MNLSKNILIADECENNRDNLKKILGNNYNLVIVEKPRSALDIMKNTPRPAIAFIAVTKSSKENIATFQAAAQLSPSTKIIAMGNSALEEKAVEAVKNGANGYIIIPLSANEIFSLIEKN